MPSSPKTFGGRRRDAKAVSISRDRKLTTTQRGYGWVWQKVRLQVLAAEPLCRFCAERDLVVVAEEVDHIDGDSFNNELSNLRPLCRECHLTRTAQDQAFGRMMWRPNWLKPSRVPLHIVCGAPASGKTTLVHQRAGPDDLIIDLDDIVAKLSGVSGHDWSRDQWLRPAIRHRNEMLGDLARRTDWPAAWLIISEPKAAHRQWWADHVDPIDITVMTTPASVSVQRARLEADRNHRGTEMLIEAWWSAFSRRPGDIEVSA